MSTTGLIIKREYLTRVKSRSFVVVTLLGVVGIIGLSFISVGMGWLEDAFATKLAIVAPDKATGQKIQAALRNRYVTTVMPERSTGPDLPKPVADQIKQRVYDAALVAYRKNGLAFTFYPRQINALDRTAGIRQALVPVVVADTGNAQLTHSLDFTFNTVALNERYKSSAEESQATVLVYFLLLLMYMAVILYGVYVAQGVIEEKSNRVMEIMIGAVRPSQLLAGKIIGVGAVALTQMTIFTLAAAAMIVVAGAQVAGRMSPAQMTAAMHQAAASGGGTISLVPPATLVFLVVFFLVGFFSYAALFAGLGAIVSKAEDAQQVNQFLIWPILIAYLLSVFALNDPEKPLFVWASMVPLISPMLMFTRVAISSVPLWQIGLSIGLSLLAIWGFTLLAAKLYRIGVLMYGKPLKPVEIWRAIRAPS
jgi:ABC-2 type transport system permease protein